MRTCLIFNPNAGSAGQVKDLRGALGRMHDVEVLTTDSPGHAGEIGAEAVDRGFTRIISAGGDGTTNEVVNGLAGHFEKLTFGIIPLGTGNDLPRTLALPIGDPVAALRLAVNGTGRPIDVVRIDYESRVRHFVNVAAGGFSGQVDEALTDEVKAAWGPLAYLRGAISVLPDITHYRTFIRYEDGSDEQVHVMNLIVANGRTAAGGLGVAPHASIEDGLLDIVAVHPGTALDLTGVAARLLAGNYVKSDIVSMRRARRVHIESAPGMWFNVDGELITNKPITFTVLPAALKVVAGRDYQPVPD